MLHRRLMLGWEEEEVKEWKTLQEATPISEDMGIIKIEIPNAKEVMIVFYGRANDAENSLSNKDDTNSIKVNNISGGIVPITYIRPSGTMFHTIIRIFAQNGYIDGVVEMKGNTNLRMFPNLILGENIENIKLVSNNLFKAESTVEIYYR